MATHRQVLQLFSERSGSTIAQVDAALRAGQEGGLSPKSGKGGGRAAVHWDASSLVSLWLITAVASPLTQAPQIVPRYRALTFGGRDVTNFRKDWASTEYLTTQVIPKRNALLPPTGSNAHDDAGMVSRLTLSPGCFGDGLDDLVGRAATCAETLQTLKTSCWSILFYLGKPTVTVSFCVGDRWFVDSYDERSNSELSRLPTYTPPPAEGARTVSYTAGAIEMLAVLLRDTLAHQAPAVPQTKPATLRPLAGSGAAGANDQPEGTELGRLQPPHSTREKENAQSSLPRSLAGRSRSSRQERPERHDCPRERLASAYADTA